MINFEPLERAAKDAAEKVKVLKAELDKAQAAAKKPPVKAEDAKKILLAKTAYSKAAAEAKEAEKKLAEAKEKIKKEAAMGMKGAANPGQKK
jgi:hypothetical protein